MDINKVDTKAIRAFLLNKRAFQLQTLKIAKYSGLSSH